MTDGPTKLLIVSPWVSSQGGGVSEAVRLLAKLMSAQPGFLVEVASTEDKGVHSQLEGWGRATIRVHRYLGPGNYRFSPGLLSHLLRSDADLIHVHGVWTFQCLAVLIWSLLTGKPYIVSPHGMLEPWILARSRGLKQIVSRLYQNAFFRRASAFHVLTESERDDVARFEPNAVCHVVANFVEPPPERPNRPAWWQPQFEARDIYLYLGRIHEKKGWRELCLAWERLCSTDARFMSSSQLIFCGWVDDSADFEPMVADLARRFGNVLFAGPQFGEARSQSLAAADAFILPSRSEGLPMVILEAWAAGVTVLMTPECNLPVGFESGAALKISCDVEGVAAGLKQFALLDRGERDRFAHSGASVYQRDFSVGSAASKFLGIYEASVDGGTTSDAASPAGGVPVP